MNIIIKGTNIELTHSIKDYVEKRASSLDKFIDSSKAEAQVMVEVGKTTNHHRAGEVFRAEVQIKHPDFPGEPRVEIENEDLYAAIDLANDEMKEILVKNKEKKKSLVKRGARFIKDLLRI